jgi:hypothetical protein
MFAFIGVGWGGLNLEILETHLTFCIGLLEFWEAGRLEFSDHEMEYFVLLLNFWYPFPCRFHELVRHKANIGAALFCHSSFHDGHFIFLTPCRSFSSSSSFESSFYALDRHTLGVVLLVHRINRPRR